MMGDRNYQDIVQNALDSLGRELKIKIDPKDIQTIHLSEVVQCLRRSYYDRVDPEESQMRGFSQLVAGLLKKLEYGSETTEYTIDDIKLKGQTDMLMDDTILLFRSAAADAMTTPPANDILYLNACMWMYDKMDGAIIYITGDRQETTFSLTRNKKRFEQLVRRVKVLNNLLKELKTPILEPSADCSDCQYYQRCFIKKKNSKQLSLSEILGVGKKETD